MRSKKNTVDSLNRIVTLYKKPVLLLYFLTIAGLLIYSYALVDPNFTLVNNDLWTNFRNIMVQFGYYQRQNSWFVYLTIIILLFIGNHFFTKYPTQFNPVKISVAVGALLLLSYPFLSHDFFNYLFDAKIVTFYHQNPYIHKALDYPADHWIRFMHWTDRNYPYGPTWLLISLIPSFFSFGKLVLDFLFFKALLVTSYIASVYYLSKLDRKTAIFFATSPLVIVEGLVSAHNDLVAVALAITGIYYLQQKRNILSRVFFVLSGGIKYITLPLVILRREDSGQARMTSLFQNLFSFTTVIGLIVYISFTGEIQPWYFLNILVLLPFYKEWVYKLNIFFAGLLLSYYPYIRLGGWDSADKVNLKHQIILVFFAGNMIYLFLSNYGKRINYH